MGLTVGLMTLDNGQAGACTPTRPSFFTAPQRFTVEFPAPLVYLVGALNRDTGRAEP